MVFRKNSTVGLIIVSLFWANFAYAADKSKVIIVDSAADVARFFADIGYVGLIGNPERLQSVPRTRITRIPEKLAKQWVENVKLRKSVSMRLGLSAALQANEQIMATRNRLLKLSLSDLSQHDRSWLEALSNKYRVSEKGEMITTEYLRQLIKKVDALPPSLIIAQGAIESGWLQSRFARKGQAIFGQWTSSQDGIKALKSDVKLAAFKTPYDSLVAYMLNINSHPAYAGLWTERAEMRLKNIPLSGYDLAIHMTAYAETGQTYVDLIQGIIRREKLVLADTAKLTDSPLVIFKRSDQ